MLKHLISLSLSLRKIIIVEDWDNHILMSPVNDSKASPYTLSQSLIAITPLMTGAVLFQGRIGAGLFIFWPQGFAGSL